MSRLSSNRRLTRSSSLHAQELCLLGLLLVGFQIESSACPLTDPDTVTESSLRYENGPYILQTVDKQPYPFGSFAISLDRNHNGHLQSYTDPHRSPRMPKMQDSVILDWTERTSYVIRGRDRTQLSLEGAKALWGAPRKHIVNEHPFYTFDAQSIYDGETNVYHLDLGFDKNGLIMAYRVRGIGLVNPKWVTSPSQAWVIEHSEKRIGETE